MKPCLALLLALASACGADSASTPPPAAPKPPPTPVAATDQCRRACEYVASCLPAGYRDHDPTACLADCRTYLEPRIPNDRMDHAKVWADCLTALPCDAIVKSMAMNEGPVGYCYAYAIPID